MLNGTINMVTDLQLALQWANSGCKVVYIGDVYDTSQIPPQFIPLPLLSPSIQVVNIEINEGPSDNYVAAYYQQLSSYECYMSFMAILAQVISDVNVIFYIEEGDNLSHAQVLQKYMMDTFGVIFGTQNNPFGFVSYKSPSIITALVYAAVDNLVPIDMVLDCEPDVLLTIPMNFMYAANLFDKIYTDTNGKVTPNNIMELIKFNVNGMKNLIVRA